MNVLSEEGFKTDVPCAYILFIESWIDSRHSLRIELLITALATLNADKLIFDKILNWFNWDLDIDKQLHQ